MTKIYVLNGANLNMLGIREPEVYGTGTLEEIRELVTARAADLGVEIDFRQSNIEGEIINWIHEAYWKADGVVLNPGGFTRTSIAIHDAIKAIGKPVVELHLANTHRREHYKPGSYITYAADATILGFSKFGYVLALEGVLDLIAVRKAKAGAAAPGGHRPMIYTVEIDFDSAAHFDDWAAWYNGNLPLMMSVPGFETAQRLEAVAGGTPRFLAIYTISDAGVFESEAYLSVGGGGTASSRWKDFIRRRRNLFSGLGIVPEIGPSAWLGVIDEDPARHDQRDLLFVRLDAIALVRSPRRRWITVLHDASRIDELRARVPGIVFYRAMAPRIASPRFDPAQPDGALRA